jgi:hypothetical protein
LFTGLQGLPVGRSLREFAPAVPAELLVIAQRACTDARFAEAPELLQAWQGVLAARCQVLACSANQVQWGGKRPPDRRPASRRRGCAASFPKRILPVKFAPTMVAT